MEEKIPTKHSWCELRPHLQLSNAKIINWTAVNAVAELSVMDISIAERVFYLCCFSGLPAPGIQTINFNLAAGDTALMARQRYRQEHSWRHEEVEDGHDRD
ncbi:unnamed protein product [Leuciscus chuanchicus]